MYCVLLLSLLFVFAYHLDFSQKPVSLEARLSILQVFDPPHRRSARYNFRCLCKALLLRLLPTTLPSSHPSLHHQGHRHLNQGLGMMGSFLFSHPSYRVAVVHRRLLLPVDLSHQRVSSYRLG